MNSSTLFRVGIAGDLPGMSCWNAETNQFEGFEIDLAYQIYLNLFQDDTQRVKLEFIKVRPADRLQALIQHDVDLIISQLTITPERSAQITFSMPYLTAREALLVLGDSDIKDVADLKNKKIAVADGTVTLQRFQKNYPSYQLIITEKESSGVDLLREHQADVMANDNVNLILMQSYMDRPQEFKVIDIGHHFPEKPFGIGIANDRSQWLAPIDAILTELKASGILNHMISNYLGNHQF